MKIRRRLAVVVTSAALVVSAPVAAGAQSEDAKGLERAKEASAQGLERARGMAGEASGQENRARGLDPDRARGLERAAEAIERARARADERQRGNNGGNQGKGNAFGRGHAQAVHEVLAGGGSPSELAGEHGAKVREMVHAYNELKKADRD